MNAENADNISGFQQPHFGGLLDEIRKVEALLPRVPRRLELDMESYRVVCKCWDNRMCERDVTCPLCLNGFRTVTIVKIEGGYL